MVIDELAPVIGRHGAEILDLMLPDMEGYEVVRRLRAARKPRWD